jgi:hypothetical protein
MMCSLKLPDRGPWYCFRQLLLFSLRQIEAYTSIQGTIYRQFIST